MLIAVVIALCVVLLYFVLAPAASDGLLKSAFRCACKCGLCCAGFVIVLVVLAAFGLSQTKFTVHVQGDDGKYYQYTFNDDKEWEGWQPSHFTLESHNHYQVLGVSSGATREEIKTAYRELVLKYHPDKNPHCEDCPDKFMKIQTAYEAIRGSRGTPHQAPHQPSHGSREPPTPSQDRGDKARRGAKRKDL